MTVRSSATLKGYFNTGDVPSEANFADLIDSAVLYDPTTGNLVISQEKVFSWAAGNGETSITLRSNGDALETNKEIRINSTRLTGSDCFGVKRENGNLMAFATDCPGFTDNCFIIFVSGQMRWGQGNTDPDCTLYRQNVGAMRLDNALGIGMNPIGAAYSLSLAAAFSATGLSSIKGVGLEAALALNNTGPSGRNWCLYSTDDAYPSVVGTGFLTIYDGAAGYRAAFTPAGNFILGTLTDGMTAGGSLAIAKDFAHRGTLAGLYNHAPAAQPKKTDHNNWATVADLAAALASIGAIDAA